MGWTVSFNAHAERQLRRLDRAAQARIVDFLSERIESGDDPRQAGKALRAAMSGLWRYRVGDYRIVCRLDDTAVTVMVIAVGHRREVYR